MKIKRKKMENKNNEIRSEKKRRRRRKTFDKAKIHFAEKQQEQKCLKDRN